jgi:hypothetical protein
MFLESIIQFFKSKFASKSIDAKTIIYQNEPYDVLSTSVEETTDVVVEEKKKRGRKKKVETPE